MFPKISIIITSYNRSNYISQAIESTLKQDYQNIEIIIIDNSSTDNSDEVISRHVSDSRVRYIKNSTNIGAVPNIIKAIRLSSGEYFTHVSADDYLIDDSFISKGVDIINKYPNISLVSAKFTCLDEVTKKYFITKETPEDFFNNGEYVSGKDVFLQYKNSIPLIMGACIMNKEKLMPFLNQKAAPVNYDAQIIMQLLLLGDVGLINNEAYVFRIHKTNLSAIHQPASIYIDNYAFIEAPYELALKLNSFSSKIINNWHKTILLKYSHSFMEKYYKGDRKQYEILKNFIKFNFPVVFKEILYSPKWILTFFLFKYPFIASNLKASKKKLIKMFNIKNNQIIYKK